jgi:hypothetical protein
MTVTSSSAHSAMTLSAWESNLSQMISGAR